MAKSIMQDERKCFLCHTTQRLQRHHCIGGANRKRADKDGLWVYLCVRHHTGDEGVHTTNTKTLRELKELAQSKWEETYGDREEFIKEYGRSYL